MKQLSNNSIMKQVVTTNKTIKVENILQHPLHLKYNKSRKCDQMVESISMTGNKPINSVVVVPDINNEDMYQFISGGIRFEAQVNSGADEIDVIVIDMTDEKEIELFIIELNKQKEQDGYEKMMVFLFYLTMYPQQKGVKGSRYIKIGKATNMGFEKVKDLVMLINFFKGDGEIVLEKVFGGELTIKDANLIKRSVEQSPEQFNSPESFEKICDPKFDLGRLSYALKNFSIDKENDFVLISSYLNKDINLTEFQRSFSQLENVERRSQNHEASKIDIPELTSEYQTKHTYILKGDNKEIEVKLPTEKLVGAIVGSSIYGLGEKRPVSLDGNPEDFQRMTGKEFAVYLAETYERFKPILKEDGSIYNIIDDYKYDNGAYSCSLEHFVVEMENRGMFLVGRYVWDKTSPTPKPYSDEDMVNGFEMVYRFVLDPENYYTNTDTFIETELTNGKKIQIKSGCTNHSKDGKTSRGNKYLQSHLKKMRNTISLQTSMDVIKGNSANPEDFFRQVDEIKHTSTAPIYLTSVLILESTRKGDLVMDIWNGVGNTMTSSLLLQREYVGIEKENTYFKQTCRRALMTEQMLEDGFAEFELIEKQKQAA